jgi:hypothetical protein
MLHTSLLRNEYLEMPRLRLTLQLAHGSVALSALCSKRSLMCSAKVFVREVRRRVCAVDG